jgi:hypothetical protein
MLYSIVLITSLALSFLVAVWIYNMQVNSNEVVKLLREIRDRLPEKNKE